MTTTQATHNATPPDPRRISEDDADYTRLHARTVAALSASLRQLVRELRHSQPHEETPILSAFIVRHTGLLRDAYTAAHGEGVRDYYDGVSRQPAHWASVRATAPSDQTITRRLSFYAPSVAKMAHEALLAWHAERRGKPPHALAEPHTGVMVAFLLDPEAAKRLAIPGGEPADELHITLAFLGDAADLTRHQRHRLRRTVENIADAADPLHGQVVGVGHFDGQPQDDTYPVYAAVRIPGIQAWRQRVVEWLQTEGLPVDTTFADYHPHITLAYVPKGQPLPVRDVPHVTLSLDHLTLAIGGEQQSWPMGTHKIHLSDTAQVLREAEAIADAASIQLMGGHLPGYTQNRNHGKFAPGNGRTEESGGGSGGSGGSGGNGMRSGRSGRAPRAGTGTGRGSGGGGRRAAGRGKQETQNTALQGHAARVPRVKPEPAKPPYPHVAHDAQGNPIRSASRHTTAGKAEHETEHGTSSSRVREAEAKVASTHEAMARADAARVPSSHPEHEARTNAYYKAQLEHERAKAELLHAQRAADSSQRSAGHSEESAKSRIEQVDARRAELDTKYGQYSEHNAQRQMERLYKDHPELLTTVAQHQEGRLDLTPERAGEIAAENLWSARRGRVTIEQEKSVMAHAHEGFQRMREISEWSLLHQSSVTPEGTITLYRGEKGRNTDAESRSRLESSAPRRGTSWTSDRSIAEEFDGGRIIQAHVPVEHIVTWHGIFRVQGWEREQEYVVGTGRISDYTFLPGTGR